MHYIIQKPKRNLSLCYSVVTSIAITRFAATTSVPRPQWYESALFRWSLFRFYSYVSLVLSVHRNFQQKSSTHFTSLPTCVTYLTRVIFIKWVLHVEFEEKIKLSFLLLCNFHYSLVTSPLTTTHFISIIFSKSSLLPT